MHGNIDTPLNRSGSDHIVDARGWIEWEGDEQSAVLEVTISQNGVKGTSSKAYQRGSALRISWDMNVTADDGAEFDRDAAVGAAAAAITCASGPGSAGWNKGVQLN